MARIFFKQDAAAMTTPTLYAQKYCCEVTTWHLRISMLHVIEFLVSERETPSSYFHSRRKKDPICREILSKVTVPMHHRLGDFFGKTETRSLNSSTPYLNTCKPSKRGDLKTVVRINVK